MSLIDFLGPIGRALDIVDQAVEDKDKAAEIRASLEALRERVYVAELQTKTIPWVDAVHKLARPAISLVAVVLPAVVLMVSPDVDPSFINAMLAGNVPAAVYHYVKGKGSA